MAELGTGRDRTCLSGEVLFLLGCLESFSLDCDLRLSTLLGERERQFKEVILETGLGTGHVWPFPVLVDEAVDLSIRVFHLDSLLDNFQRANYSLAGRFAQGYSLVSIKGIIGLDLVRYFGPLQLLPCFQGWAFSVPARLVPFDCTAR